MRLFSQTGAAGRPRNAILLLLAFVATWAPPNRVEGYKCLSSALYLVRPTMTVIEGSGDPDAEIERWPRENVHLSSRDPIGFDMRSPTLFFHFEAEP